MDLVDQIMAFEQGLLSDEEIIDLFAVLIQSGDAWRLQGSYGRTAKSLIDQGFISVSGERLVERGE